MQLINMFHDQIEDAVNRKVPFIIPIGTIEYHAHHASCGTDTMVINGCLRELEKEKEILRNQALNEGKPAQIIEKMVEGRVKKFYQDVCLLEQAFVKDPSMKVSQVLKDATIVEFARFEKGEGIEKKEENFAEEVMKQLQ